jgi:hypothetical protein
MPELGCRAKGKKTMPQGFSNFGGCGLFQVEERLYKILRELFQI